MEGKTLKNCIPTLLLSSLLLASPAAWGARDLSVLRVRGAVLACPVPDPGSDARAVLEAVAKGKYDKARRRLASLRLTSVPHPEVPLLAALTDFAEGRDPSGAGLLALLDPAVGAHAQIRAELTALGGDPCRAAGLYRAVPGELVDALRLRPRIADLDTACLDTFSAKVDARWAEGDFTTTESLVSDLPAPLREDARAALALFPSAILAGDAARARTLLERLPSRDRDRCGPMVSALELDPSLRLSYLKQGGEGLMRDPLGQALYARALDEWLVGNMPEDFRTAWTSTAMTQRDLALLLCLHFPGLKGGAVPGTELPEAVLEDPQADCLAALVSQGFLPGYRADGPVAADDAVRALAKALESTGLVAPCGPGRDAWVRCGMMPAGWGEGPLSGQQWSALAHRARGDLQ